MNDQFVKLPVCLLYGYENVSLKSKILYCILHGKISYSRFKDDQGKYYFLSSDEREEIGKPIGIDSSRTFDRCVAELKAADLLDFVKTKKGCKVYEKTSLIPPKLAKDSAKNGGTVSPKMAEPLYNQTNVNQNNSKLENDIDNRVNKTNSIVPEFYDVLKYWHDKTYHSNPADFFNYYSSKKWVVSGAKVRDWTKLADKWEDCELYKCVLTEKDYLKLPDDVKIMVDDDQKKYGENRVRQITYKAIQKAQKRA